MQIVVNYSSAMLKNGGEGGKKGKSMLSVGSMRHTMQQKQEKGFSLQINAVELKQRSCKDLRAPPRIIITLQCCVFML